MTVKHLGQVDYQQTWADMQSFTDHRETDTRDQIWTLEHPPVFTLGQAGKREHVLAPGNIPVIHVDRGGQVTYHGPGQLVMYPLLDLRRLGIGIRHLVHQLEGAVIDTLAGYDIAAARRDGAPGVYVDNAKIAALGLRVRRGCTFHGVAFNVNMDLSPYQRINPCGFEGLAVTQTSAHGGPDELTQVASDLLGHLAARLNITLDQVPASAVA